MSLGILCAVSLKMERVWTFFAGKIMGICRERCYFKYMWPRSWRVLRVSTNTLNWTQKWISSPSRDLTIEVTGSHWLASYNRELPHSASVAGKNGCHGQLFLQQKARIQQGSQTLNYRKYFSKTRTTSRIGRTSPLRTVALHASFTHFLHSNSVCSFSASWLLDSVTGRGQWQHQLVDYWEYYSAGCHQLQNCGQILHRY